MGMHFTKNSIFVIERYATNPQHLIDLSDSNPFDGEDVCSLVVSLAQRQVYGKPFRHIGFKVYSVPNHVNRIDATYMRRHAPVMDERKKI